MKVRTPSLDLSAISANTPVSSIRFTTDGNGLAPPFHHTARRGAIQGRDPLAVAS